MSELSFHPPEFKQRLIDGEDLGKHVVVVDPSSGLGRGRIFPSFDTRHTDHLNILRPSPSENIIDAGFIYIDEDGVHLDGDSSTIKRKTGIDTTSSLRQQIQTAIQANLFPGATGL